jgi:hypothetical protein
MVRGSQFMVHGYSLLNIVPETMNYEPGTGNLEL